MIARTTVEGTGLIIQCDGSLSKEAHQVFRKIEAAVSEGLRLEDGTRIQVGWSVLTLRREPDGLRVCEPAFDDDRLEQLNPTLDITLGVLRSQVQVLHRVGEGGVDISYWQAVLATRGAIAIDGVYLKRLEPITERDTGWFIGDLNRIEDATEQNTEAVQVYELLRLRPATLQVLALPPGYIVTMSGQEILQVFDADGRDRWNSDRQLSPPIV